MALVYKQSGSASLHELGEVGRGDRRRNTLDFTERR